MKRFRILHVLGVAGLFVGLAAVAVPAAAQSVGGTVIYADSDAAGGDMGTSWADAFKDLQDAPAMAEAGDELWVAEGMYRQPTERPYDLLRAGFWDGPLRRI